MQLQIHERFRGTRDAEIAKSALSACVHCGFCNATCPTYLDLGDERDGPRGRIYLIKQLLETGTASEHTQKHLDRCLTCRSCETTCPSGVQYGRLLDVGRGILEQDLQRPWHEKIKRKLLMIVVPYPARFAFLLTLARMLRFVLPRAMRNKIPAAQQRDKSNSYSEPDAQAGSHDARTMLVLDGCAQAAATPATNAAARRVFKRMGIRLLSAPQAGCCGALHFHLGEQDPGKAFMRANIDAWWPYVERGIEAIVVTASGCGTTVKEYGEILADDEVYADKAARISSIARDLVEVLDNEHLESRARTSGLKRFALHCPCTLQHGQKLGSALENLLLRMGLEVVESENQHLCCGSAGSYSLLQPEISERLRERKIADLTQNLPDTILTANVGCQLHLASGTDVPVEHWIEAVDIATREAN